MDAKQVLEQVRSGAISVEDAEQFFRRAPYEELGYAKLDTHRKLRSGFGEVVFCSGKADEFLSSIFEKDVYKRQQVRGSLCSHRLPGCARNVFDYRGRDRRDENPHRHRWAAIQRQFPSNAVCPGYAIGNTGSQRPDYASTARHMAKIAVRKSPFP